MTPPHVAPLDFRLTSEFGGAALRRGQTRQAALRYLMRTIPHEKAFDVSSTSFCLLSRSLNMGIPTAEGHGINRQTLRLIYQAIFDQGRNKRPAAIGDDVTPVLLLQHGDFVDKVAFCQYGVVPF